MEKREEKNEEEREREREREDEMKRERERERGYEMKKDRRRGREIFKRIKRENIIGRKRLKQRLREAGITYHDSLTRFGIGYHKRNCFVPD